MENNGNYRVIIIIDGNEYAEHIGLTSEEVDDLCRLAQDSADKYGQDIVVIQYLKSNYRDGWICVSVENY